MNARWFLVVISVAALGLAIAGIVAARTHARGRWTVVEFESRGPHRTARVLINDRTGVVCEVNRVGSSPADSSLGSDAFWMCNQPPKGGQPFMPK